MRINQDDTIFATATAHGNAAIAVIRISGSKTFEICKKIFVSEKKNFSLDNIKSHKIYFGQIHDSNGFVDDVLMSAFIAPHSYTAEDVVEFSVHSSSYIINRISEALVYYGARLANNGEFTMRAFMNGKLDLSQAEAVADIIASHSEASHTLAFKQFRGEFSKKISKLRAELLNFSTLIELELDFSEEDIEFADRKDLEKLLQTIYSEVKYLKASYSKGNVIKKGIPVAIIGKPNVGKSTLLNLLLKDDRAIVSDIPGTTRDALEDIISINGASFRFIDTAGLRQTYNTIEVLSIQRTLKKVEQSSIVILVVDITKDTIEDIKNEIAELSEKVEELDKKKIIIAANKIDMLIEMPKGFQQMIEMETVFISAKRKENIEMIEDALLRTVKNQNINDDFAVSNIRHYEALHKAEQAIENIIEGMKDNLPLDLITTDMHDVLFHLGTITGEITTDDILESVFSNFCVGK